MNYFIVVSFSFSSNESEILKTTRVTLCDKNEGFHLISLKRSEKMEECEREKKRERVRPGQRGCLAVSMTICCQRKRRRSLKVLQHLRVIHLRSDFVNEKKTFFCIPHSNFHGNELMSNEKCGKFSLVNDNQNGMVAHTNIQSVRSQ